MVGRGFGRRLLILRRRFKGWGFQFGVQGYALRFGIEDVCHYCQLREILAPADSFLSPQGVAVTARTRSENRTGRRSPLRELSGCGPEIPLPSLLRWNREANRFLPETTRCAYG